MKTRPVISLTRFVLTYLFSCFSCFHVFVDGYDCKIQYVCIFHLFQWRIHYPVLSRLAVGQTLMVNQLVDMEWKFGGKQWINISM